MRGVKRFEKKGKLSPHYVVPYEILSRVGKVAYEVELPSELSFVHPIFQVSMLRKLMLGVFIRLSTITYSCFS